MKKVFILKVYSDHIKIYIKNRNQKLTQMTYYCIGSESDAVIWKEEEREREREKSIADHKNDNSFARELPVSKAGCTIYS